MRGLQVLPLVLGVLGACVTQDSGGSYSSDPGWGTGPGGYGGEPESWCESDSDCTADGSGLVCARDGECLAPTGVHMIHVAWMVSGQPASAATCTNAPDLELSFDYENDSTGDGGFGFAPVPCAEGKFTIDKMPTLYQDVFLVRNMDYSGGSAGVFDGSGDVSLDLPY